MGNVLMFERINEDLKVNNEVFNDLDSFYQVVILQEAYAEKEFRECPEHRWSLHIDFGSVSITCDVCDGDFSYTGAHDYIEDLNGSVSLAYVKWEQERNREGLVTDSWLEIG